MYRAENATHQCTVSDDGLIVVDAKRPAQVRETTINPDGSTSTVTRPAHEIFPTASHAALHNVFQATFYRPGLYTVDMACGCQRWNGTQSGVAVGKALRACGFDARPIMRRARRHQHNSVPRACL